MGALCFGPEAREWTGSKTRRCVHFTANQEQAGVGWESPGLENIPKFPGNQPKVCQNHDARKAVSATLSVLKWTGGYILAQKLEIERSKSFALLHFTANQGHQELV